MYCLMYRHADGPVLAFSSADTVSRAFLDGSCRPCRLLFLGPVSLTMIYVVHSRNLPKDGDIDTPF